MKDPEYVNQGPDKRAGGVLGHVFAWLQRTLSFHSTRPPFDLVWRPGRWRVGVQFSQPGWLPFFVLFVPRGAGHWASLRAGWRRDENWGAGGYIADVIIKMRINNTSGLVVLLAVVLTAVGGCGARQMPPPTIVRIVEPIEVKVPVPVVRAPPQELLVPLTPPLPIFVDPQDPEASSALTAEGERLLRGMIEELLSRVSAWTTWATEGN